MKKISKIFLSLSIVTSSLLSDDLFVKVNYGEGENIFHNTDTNYLNFPSSSIPEEDKVWKNPDKLNINSPVSFSKNGNSPSYCTEGSNAYNNYFNNYGSSGLYENNCTPLGNETEIRKQVCKGSQILEEKDSKMVGFTPKVEISRGEFYLQNGNIAGIPKGSYININEFVDTLLNKSNEEEQELFIGENFNKNNWVFIKTIIDDNSTTISKLKTIQNNLNNQIDKDVISYIVDIYNLGEKYKQEYLNNETVSSVDTQLKDVCISSSQSTEYQNKFDNFNTNLSQDFMKLYDVNRTIVSFNKTSYIYEEGLKNNKNCFGWLCKKNEIKTLQQPQLSKIFAYKIFTENDLENKLKATQILQTSVSNFIEPESVNVAIESNLPEVGSQFIGDTINTINNASKNVTIGSLDTSTEPKKINYSNIVEKVNKLESVSNIYEKCKNELDVNFIGNLVFVDGNSMILGNNQYLVKNDFKDVAKTKPISLSIEPTLLNLQGMLATEHGIVEGLGDILGGYNLVPVDSNGDIANSNEVSDLSEVLVTSNGTNDLSYFYLHGKPTAGSECEKALNGNNNTAPFLLMENSMEDLKNNSLNSSNEQNNSQYVIPADSIVLKTNDSGFDRGTDGEIDAEIEKRLDSYTRSEKFKNNKNDKVYFPKNNLAYSYLGSYKNMDESFNNKYGPLTNLWNPSEKLVEEIYRGCDSSTSTPLKDTVCTNSIVDLTQLTCSYDEAGKTISSSGENCTTLTNKTNYTDNFNEITYTFNDGTYEIYEKETNNCNCSSGKEEIEYAISKKGSSNILINLTKERANEETKYTKFYYVSLEPMKGKIKRTKWFFEPTTNEGVLNITGFQKSENEDGDPDTTQWGNWTQTEWVESQEFKIDNYISDVISSKTWKKEQVEPNINPFMDKSIPSLKINNKNYSSNDFKYIKTNNLEDLAANFPIGIRYANKHIYTFDIQKQILNCVKDKNSSDETIFTTCNKKVFDSITGANTEKMDEDSFTNFFELEVLKYMEAASKLGFGDKLVINLDNKKETASQFIYEDLEKFLTSTSETLKTKVFKVSENSSDILENLDVFWNKELE